MEISVSIVPDDRTMKMVNNYRFNFDKELLKEEYPYISVVGPIGFNSSIRNLEQKIEKVIKSTKPFKIELDGVTNNLKVNHQISYKVKIDQKLKALYEQIFSCDCFGHLDDDLDSMELYPHIVLCRREEEDELQDIFDELSEKHLKHDFFVRQIQIKVKDKKDVWDTYREFEF